MPKVYNDDMFPMCPMDDFSCPYYSEETGRCMMFEQENVLPFDECDAFCDIDDDADEMGFDPYEGCYTYDC